MNPLPRLTLIGIAWLVGFSVCAVGQKPEKTDDPLPPGAKVRFGVTRPILRTSPGVALIPPNYTNFLAPTLTGGIRRYDLGTGRPLDKKGIVGPGQVVVSANGKRAVVARPGAVTVVEVSSGKQILAVQPPEGVIIVGTPGVSLSGDGKIMAFGARGMDGKAQVVLWDVEKNEVLGQIDPALAAPVFPTLSPDGKTLVTHGPPAPAPTLKETKPAKLPAPVLPDSARQAQVWEVESGKELFKARVTGMGGMVVAAAFSPASDLVALSAGDGAIDLWQVKTGKRLQTLLGRKGQGVRVAFSPDGKTVASVGPDYRIQRWSTDGKLLDINDPPAGILVAQITGLTFPDNDRVIAWLTAAQFAVAWEAPASKLLSPFMDHAAAVNSIAFPDGGKDGLTSGRDGRVFRWDLANGQLAETITLRPARLPGQPLVAPVVSLSPDGNRAVWLRTPAEVFDVTTGEDLYCIPAPSSPPAPVFMILSADGKKVVSVSRQAADKREASCVVWDLATQRRVAELAVTPSATVNAPMGLVSPDGTRLVIATATRTVERAPVFVIAGFDLKTGKKLAEVLDPAATGSMTIGVANNTTAVVTSTSGRVWTVDYVKGQVEPDIDRLPVRGERPVHGPVVFSPDGKRFAIGVVGERFTTYGVRVYDLPRRKLLRTFIGHAGPVSALRFTPDGNLLASGAQDTSVLLWDLSKMLREKKE